MFIKKRALPSKMAAMTILTSPRDVLEYWFVNTRNGVLSSIQQRMAVWFFRSVPDFEAVQLENEGLIDKCANDETGWDLEHDHEAVMATVIVLDQFSRAVHRGTARAFESDEKSAAIIRRMLLETDWFIIKYSPIERLFLIVALQHSEKMENQELGVSLAPRVGENATEDIIEYFESIKGFPMEHYDVIKQFGRYPHRNELLSRESTAEELQWLESPDCPAWAKSQKKLA
ncbi:DUF924 domain-containing protein [archaeon]|nr:MAG: DUF924 domain-containing protein [archaeon]